MDDRPVGTERRGWKARFRRLGFLTLIAVGVSLLFVSGLFVVAKRNNERRQRAWDLEAAAAREAAALEVKGEDPVAPVMEVMARVRDEITAGRVEYFAMLEAADFPTMFTPERIATVQAIEESERLMKVALERLSELPQRNEAALTAALAEVEAMPLPPRLKADAMPALRRNWGNAIASGRVMAEVDMASMEEVLVRLGIVKRALGGFQVDEEMIVFDAESDGAEFVASEARQLALTRLQTALKEISAADDETGELAAAFRPREGPALVLTKEGITLGGEPVALPWPLAEARRVLGEPDEYSELDHVTMAVWRDRGVLAVAPPGETAAVQVYFGLGGDDPDERVFTGRIELLGVEVKRHDTPWSLNRRLGDRRFECIDDAWTEWLLPTETYGVSMSINPDGLSGLLMVRTVKLVETDELTPEDVELLRSQGVDVGG